MAINTQAFSAIVSNAVAAVQGAATQLVDFTKGSINLALIQAASGIALWLQGLIIQVAALTRASTSNNADLDSWMAQFNFRRLAPVPAKGSETFSRFTSSTSAVIQAATNAGIDVNGNVIWTGGQLVQTQDGTQEFMVIPDTGQPTYNSSTNTYILPIGVPSGTATVIDTQPGSTGNVVQNSVTVLSSSIPGIDTVNNVSAFTGGADAESDTAFRARFVLYIASLAEGTPIAVEDAVLNLQEGATVELVENFSFSGVFQAGYFYCVVDDGSGNPSMTFLQNCINAINKVRAVGTTFNVFAPSLLTANVALTLTPAPGFVLSALQTQVTAALTAFINSLPIGIALSYTRIAAIAYDTVGVQNVTNVTLNGAIVDLNPTVTQLIKVGTIVYV